MTRQTADGSTTESDRVDVIEEQLSELADKLYQEQLERGKNRRQIYALQEENETLREQVRALEDELDALRDNIATDPCAKRYADQSRDERVHDLRVAVARRARKNGGRAYYDYRDVLSHFGEQPSDGYAFKLMRDAAGYDEESGESSVAGFEYGDHHGQLALRANWDDVSDAAVVHAVKNGEGEEDRS